MIELIQNTETDVCGENITAYTALHAYILDDDDDDDNGSSL